MIWAQVEAELKREGKTAADEGKTEDELRRNIARSPNAGCVSAWCWAAGRAERHRGAPATKSQRAIMARARQHQGREQEAFQF